MHNVTLNKQTIYKNYTMPLPHSHNFYELYVLAKGKREYFIENQRFEIEPNSIIIVPKGVLHYTSGGDFTRYVVNFTEDDITPAQNSRIEILQQQLIPMTGEEANRIFDILETLLTIQTNDTKSYATQKESDFLTAFSYLMYHVFRLSALPTKKFYPKSFDYRTKKVMEYIQEHYAESITLDFLSKYVFMSKHALCHLFKKDTDMTIIDYLLKTRLKYAESCLKFSDKKMNEIAQQCGFSSQNYFYIIFTKHVKMSPSEYRKIHKEYFKKINDSTPSPKRPRKTKD